MLKPEPSSRFKKDLKKYQHNKSVKEAFDTVLKLLIKEKQLPEKYLDHPLSGNYVGCRECHLRYPAHLLDNDEIVYLSRIGSHSELF